MKLRHASSRLRVFTTLSFPSESARARTLGGKRLSENSDDGSRVYSQEESRPVSAKQLKTSVKILTRAFRFKVTRRRLFDGASPALTLDGRDAIILLASSHSSAACAKRRKQALKVEGLNRRVSLVYRKFHFFPTRGCRSIPKGKIAAIASVLKTSE